MRHKLVTNQIEISVLANQAFINGDIAFLQEKSIAPMAWSPLAGGALFSAGHEKLVSVLKKLGDAQGVDISAVAIAWLLAHPARIMPVLGTNNLARIAQISDATKVTINRQSWFEIYEAANQTEVP